MSSQISRATVVFSCLGHLYIHLCTAFFFIIVLSLESVWQRPYHELIELWTLGSLMVGVVALPAGMLSDRLGASRLMVAYFIGMGGCAVAAGLTDSPDALMWCLAGMGVFGIKFVLSFGAAPLAVQLVATISGRTGDFYWVYALLTGFAFAAVCVALLLPRAQGMPVPQPAGAD